MFRSVFASIVLAALAVTQVSAVIPVGGICSGIAGPNPTDVCAEGSACCSTGPDRSYCTTTLEGQCPDAYVEEGGFCSGIAGPSQYPCAPGTQCCYQGPDNSVCLSKCRKVVKQ